MPTVSKWETEYKGQIEQEARLAKSFAEADQEPNEFITKDEMAELPPLMASASELVANLEDENESLREAIKCIKVILDNIGLYSGVGLA